MNKLLVVITFTAFSALGGCKIQMSSTTGGSITTESGSYSCQPNSVCPPVDVNDIHFDETFIAKPADGYEFAGWRKRDRGLCGGNRQPCRLFTSGFVGNNALLAFLDRPQEVFYLEAIFRERPQGSTGDARSCYNATLGTADTSIVARYRSTDASGAVLTTDYEQRIAGGARFNGRDGSKGTSDTRVTGAAPSTSKTVAYFQPDNTRFRITQLGLEVESFTPAASRTRITFQPERLDRFDLTAGQSYTQNYTTRVSTTVNGFTTEVSNATGSTTTFLGVEAVTVPAGTYQACKFRVETSGDNSILEEWFGVGNGMLLKSTGDGDTNELVSARINGASI